MKNRSILINTLHAMTLLAFSPISNSKPIEILGINIGMPVLERSANLERRGYKCGETEKSTPEAQIFLCKYDDKKIYIKDDLIVYNCLSINACQHTLEEITDALLSSNIIPKAEYKMDTKYYDERIVYIPTYCGRGTDGDVACIIEDENYFGVKNKQLRILKSSFGNNKIILE